MKSETSPEFQKFDALVRKVLAVPHSKIKARIEEEKKQRKQKKGARASPASRAADASS
jgi:hypothetical protein